MPLMLYTDVHIAKAVATQLRNRGVDVMRAQDIGMDDAEDLEHLVYATSEGRAVLTFDSDFENLHYQWMQEDRHHAGIFLLRRDKDDIGMIVTTLFFWHEAIEGEAASVEQDVWDHLHDLPEG